MIAEILYSRPGYDSIRGRLFAQVTHVGLVAGNPLRPESYLACSRPSRCTCGGLRLKLKGYPHYGRGHLPRRMGSGSHCCAPLCGAWC